MKIYFANMLSTQGIEQYLKHKIDILAAFPSFSKQRIKELAQCDSLFVDSGAFGKNSSKISLDNYIQFIKNNKSKIDLYANLDVIGNANKTYQNQKEMEKEGLTPLPVFHYGSSEEVLKKYLRKRYSYISLGGMVPISSPQLQMWLDNLWADYLTDSKGFPIIKVHGFGLQIKNLLSRYPWYSVDASSIHVIARFGGIYTPWGTFKINPNVNADELKWQTPGRLIRVKNFVERLGFDFTFEEAQEQSITGTLRRCAISIRYFLQWVEENKTDRFKKELCQG